MRSVQRNEEGEGLSQIEVCIYISLRCVSSIRHMRVAAQHAASPLYKGCQLLISILPLMKNMRPKSSTITYSVIAVANESMHH